MADVNEIPLLAKEEAQSVQRVTDVLVSVLRNHRQPSAWDLVGIVEGELGWKSCWSLKAAVNKLKASPESPMAWRSYLDSLTKSDDLDAALRGVGAPQKEIASSIDSLLRQSRVYRDSEEFRETVSFIAKFKDYAPFNNLLVRMQNPACSYYATERDWWDRFRRKLKEDARPMLILAPMHPVMPVYALDETEGKELPKSLENFATYRGEWKPDWWRRTVENARIRDRIRVDAKILSSTLAGFATLARGTNEWKIRIAIHSELDEPSRYGILCHELAHIYLGHLGTDGDHWWPSRTNLDKRTVEIEAEATAFIVTARLGLVGSGAAYISSYLKGGSLPSSVSLDQVAKVASRIEQMAERSFRARERRSPRQDASRI